MYHESACRLLRPSQIRDLGEGGFAMVELGALTGKGGSLGTQATPPPPLLAKYHPHSQPHKSTYIPAPTAQLCTAGMILSLHSLA